VTTRVSPIGAVAMSASVSLRQRARSARAPPFSPESPPALSQSPSVLAFAAADPGQTFGFGRLGVTRGLGLRARRLGAALGDHAAVGTGVAGLRQRRGPEQKRRRQAQGARQNAGTHAIFSRQNPRRPL
jgi:hypothetical protein